MDERRDRLIHTLLGAGTLVWEDDFKMRFEVDSGPVLRFKWAMIGIGTPDYHRRCKRNKQLECTEEERHWTTIKTTDGETYAFRKEGVPLPVVASAAVSAQTEMNIIAPQTPASTP